MLVNGICCNIDVAHAVAGQKFAMQEEKIVLASVMRRFEVTSLDTREQLQMMGEIIMRPKTASELRSRIEKRNEN